eukprot:6490863-Amphidinium_carterae.4
MVTLNMLLLFHKMSCQHEEKWALFATSQGRKVATGDHCEVCFTLWQTGFIHLSWHDLCSKAKGDGNFKLLIQGARQALDGTKSFEGDKPELFQRSTHTLCIERTFLVASEKDIRKSTGVERVKREFLKSIPSITVTDALTAEPEVLYMFADPSNPCRKAVVSTSCSTHLESQNMSKSQVLWEGQGTALQTHFTKEQAHEAGLDEVLQKHAGGHVRFQDYDMFIQQVSQKFTDDADEGGDVEGANPHGYAGASLEGEVLLEGVAAKRVLEADAVSKVITPYSKKSKVSPGQSSLARSQSGLSVAASSALSDGQGNALANDDDADMGEGSAAGTFADDGPHCKEEEGILLVSNPFYCCGNMN